AALGRVQRRLPTIARSRTSPRATQINAPNTRRFDVRSHRRSPRLGRASLGCAQSFASWSGWRRSWSSMLLPIAVTLAIALVGFLNQTSNYARYIPRNVIARRRADAIDSLNRPLRGLSPVG